MCRDICHVECKVDQKVHWGYGIWIWVHVCWNTGIWGKQELVYRGRAITNWQGMERKCRYCQKGLVVVHAGGEGYRERHGGECGAYREKGSVGISREGSTGFSREVEGSCN